jgi:carbon-monoxide dehydrogenase large subunit
MSAPPITAGRYIGQRIPRKEDGRLLTGRGAFVDDITLPGMLHVAFVRSPIARGKIKSIDVSAARDMRGVHAVLTAADLGKYNLVITSYMMADLGEPRVRPLSSDYVCYVGDPVAMVVADSRYVAEDAAGLVFVDYEHETPVLAMPTEAPLVHPSTQSNVAAVADYPEVPDLKTVFQNAPHVASLRVKHQRIVQSTMETRGVLSHPQGEGELTVYIGCQSTHMAARMIGITLGWPESSIRVIAKDVGGGFGLKAQPWREEIAAICASLVLQRPVKWIEDRLEALTSSNPAREQDCTVRVAMDNEGHIQAFDVDYACNNGAYPHWPDANFGAMMYFCGPYRIRLFGYKGRGYYTNTVGLGGYRGPWAIEALARETLFEVAAKKVGLDSVEFRRRNLLTKAELPFTSVMGVPVDDISIQECLDLLLEKVDVQAFRAEQNAARAEGRYLGLGIATYIEPTASGGMPALESDMAWVRIEQSGKVTANMSTHSQGHGTETTMAQLIAERLGVRFEDVSIFQEDSTRSGFGPGAAGSRQAVTAGSAALKASSILVDKIKRIAAHVFNANADDIRIEDGVVRVGNVEEMTSSVREIAEIAYGQPARLPAGMEMGLEAQHRVQTQLVYTSAAHACIVEVDAVTGFVRIKRWVCAEDCGVVINPGIVEGQIAGGLTQGIGEVLLEEFTLDENGNPTAVTFKDYMLPAITDAPDFEYAHITTPSKTESGARGVGEGGIIIGPPTLVNAIMDALAPFNPPLDCIEMPYSPSRILEIIERGGAAASA